MQIYYKVSDSKDTIRNLAVEQGLSKLVNKKAEENIDLLCFFIWQSQDAVVVGRNQNIQRECNIELAKSHNTSIVRRTTGGGAVYQDLGNVCFSIIATDTIYNVKENFELVIEALSKLGIRAEISGRNDILVGQRKISGNAFSKSGRACLHHGTLLVNTDLDYASQVLTPSEYKLKSKGISSVKGRIMNLAELDPSIKATVLMEKLIESFEGKYLSDGSNVALEDMKLDESYISDMEQKLKSPEWLDLKGKKTSREITGDFGTFSYSLIEEADCIKDIIYETDIINTNSLAVLVENLKGTQIEEEAIFEKYEAFLRQENPDNDSKALFDKIIVAIVNSIMKEEDK